MLPKNSIVMVYQYYFDHPAYKLAVLRSMREFFDRPDLKMYGAVSGSKESMGLYNEWFLYDFDFEGSESVLAHFVHTNPLKLPAVNMQMYRDLLDHKYGLFEICSVEPLKGATLRLLPDGDTFNIIEFSGTMDMQEGWGVFGRVARVGDHYEMVGADSFTVPIADPEFQPYLKKLLALKKITPKSVDKMFTTGKIS